MLTGIVTTNDVIVSPQVAGQVSKLLVAEGDSLTTNQLLAGSAPPSCRPTAPTTRKAPRRYATIDAPSGSSPEAKLRHYIRTFVPRIARPAAWIMGIMRHEMNEPTALAPAIAERTFMPRNPLSRRCRRRAARLPQTDPHVALAVISVQSQCLFSRPDPFRDRVFPGWPLTDAQLTQAAEHIAEFSIAGIKGIAARRTVP